MGAALCFVAFSTKSKYKKLAQTGEKTEGTLEGYESVKIKNNTVQVPVASFVTKTGKAITQKTENSFFPANARKGAKIVVLYNPEHPHEFMIQGKKFTVMNTVVMIGGIVFFLTGIFLLLNYLSILHILKLK